MRQFFVIAGTVAVVVALVVLRQRPEAWWPGIEPADDPAGWVWLVVPVVAVAASYRPLGGLLGFGALLLPHTAVVAGSPLAAALGLCGCLASALVVRSLYRRDPERPGERRRPRRLLLDSIHAAAATLVAGALWVVTFERSAMLAVASSTIAWVGVGHGLAALEHGGRSGSRRHAGASIHLLWDAFGWSLACSISLLATSVGMARLAPLVIGFVLLTGVGASREIDRRLHLRRIRDLEHVGSVTQRLVPRERASALAQQCLEEVRRAVDVSYAQLDLSSNDGPRTFHVQQAGPLLSGPATVPDHPPPAPGIHLRRDWIHLERDLRAERGDDGDDSGSVLGHLRVWIDPRNAGDHDQDLVDDLSPQIAALLDRSRLDREARLDSLTGLCRRHIFDRELERRLEAAREDGHSVALLLFDLDHFKQINDGYGHDAGDRVLESTAAVLLRAAQPGGLACRWGGEELALLHWFSGDDGLRFAEEVRRFIAEQSVPTDAGDLEVTTSVGVAAFPDLLVREPKDLVVAADEALYAAKNHGRNRALLACGRNRFRDPSGRIVGNDSPLDPSHIPQL